MVGIQALRQLLFEIIDLIIPLAIVIMEFVHSSLMVEVINMYRNNESHSQSMADSTDGENDLFLNRLYMAARSYFIFFKGHIK